MRKRFEQQIVIGRLLIQDTKIPTAKRSGALPGLCAALKEIFVTPEWNEKIFEVIENKLLSNNNKTGRLVWIFGKFLFCHKCGFVKTSVMTMYTTLPIMTV